MVDDQQQRATPSGSQITYQISPPEGFNFSCPGDWPRWRRRFERFRYASGLNTKSGLEQVNALVYTMGDEADEIMASFNLTQVQQSDYTEVINSFESHFVIRKNTIYERARFNIRVQEENETVDSYVTALYTLSEHCEYQGLREQLIRDRIVVGLRDRKLAESLQMDADLTLARAIERARQSGGIKKQQMDLFKDGGSKNVAQIHNVESKNRHPGNFEQRNQSYSMPNDRNDGKNKTNPVKKCRWCGRAPVHDKVACPAKDKTCINCKKKGHFSNVCRSKKMLAIATEEQAHTGEELPFYMGMINAQNKFLENKWTINLKIGGISENFSIDTGTDVSAIPLRCFKRYRLNEGLEKTNRSLLGPGGKLLQVMGSFCATLAYNGRQTKQTMYIVNDLQNRLLEKPAIEKLNIIERIYQISINQYRRNFPNCSQDWG